MKLLETSTLKEIVDVAVEEASGLEITASAVTEEARPVLLRGK